MKPFRMVLLATVLACTGAGVLNPTVASAVPALAPCAAGVPVASDFDGDAAPELVVGARRLAGTESVREQYLQPGDGGAAVWIHDTGELRSADLNGDVCADAILFRGGHEPWLKLALGRPDGLDVAGATEITIPQAADVADDPRRSLAFEAAGLRHDGISQIVLSGRHVVDLEEDGPEDYGAYVDVLTLDASLAVTTTQVLEFPEVDRDVWDFGISLATSGRTFAVGHPSAIVNGKVGAGSVRIYTADDADPTHFVLRKTLTQNSAGVPGTAEVSDGFGSSLAMRNGRLAIGAPGESDGRLWSSGLVQPIVWHEATGTYKAYRAITQDTSGVPGVNQEGDLFGEHVAIARGLTASGSYDILIGAAELHGKLGGAGSVTVANFTRSIYRTYTQSTRGIPGSSEARDYFEHVGVLRTSPAVDTVLIGAPGEDTGGVSGVGRAIRSDGRKLSSKTTWTSIPIPADAPADLIHWGEDFAAIG